MTGTNKKTGTVLGGLKNLLSKQSEEKETSKTTKATASKTTISKTTVSKAAKTTAKPAVKKAGTGITKNAKKSLEAYKSSKGSDTKKQVEVLHTKTHQDLINVGYKAAEELGIAPWVLLRAAGWGNFTDDRGKKYDGPAIDDLEGLDDAQKAALKKVLGL